jgi:cytochrome c oxidase subunit II
MRSPAIAAFVLAAAVSGAVASEPHDRHSIHEVSIVAKKFAFEPQEIQVVAGEPVRLVLRSADVGHGFAIHELKIDLPIPNSVDPVVAEFIAPPAGRYEIACSEFCGRGHAQMKATLVSVAPTQSSR